MKEKLEPAKSFQDLILTLQHYWGSHGCAILQGYDMEVGAGTFHPATILRALSDEPWKAAYAQACRRPTDGRYGQNPNRLQHYYQFQVVLKPSPENIQELYLGSLAAIGLDANLHDIRFVEDDWESPSLGATGLGWECWCDGMEVSQFTYFQQVCGIECSSITGEITYGLERIALYLQQLDNVYDLNFNGRQGADKLTYGDVFLSSEIGQCYYNFELANVENLMRYFEEAKQECGKILQYAETSGQYEVVFAAYEQCIKASHFLNLLQARGAISVSARQRYILEVRSMAHKCALIYIKMKNK